MIPVSYCFDQSTIATLLEHDPLVSDYRTFFSLLDWSLVEAFHPHSSARGRPGHPLAASLKAFLVRIREGLCYRPTYAVFCSHIPSSSSNSASISSPILPLSTVLTLRQPCPVTSGCVTNCVLWTPRYYTLCFSPPAPLSNRRFLDSAKPSPLMSSTFMLGSKKTTRVPTSVIAMTRRVRSQATPTAN